ARLALAQWDSAICRPTVCLLSRTCRYVPMAQSKGRSVREANGPARSEPVQVRVQPLPMLRPRDRWWLAAVVIAAVVPYLNSLPGAFVFDDFGLATQNPYATPGMPLLAW